MAILSLRVAKLRFSEVRLIKRGYGAINQSDICAAQTSNVCSGSLADIGELSSRFNPNALNESTP